MGSMKDSLYGFLYRYVCGTMVMCVDRSLRKGSECFNVCSDTFVVPFIVCLDHILWKDSVFIHLCSDAYYNAASPINSALYIMQMLMYFD